MNKEAKILPLRHEIEDLPFTERLDILVNQGRKQGFASETDIISLLPETEDIDILEETYELLLDNQIEIREEEESGTSFRYEDFESEDETRTAEEGLKRSIDHRDLISAHLNQAGRLPLLTREEEVELAKRIQQGRKASTALSQDDRSDWEIKELQKRIEDGQAAREHLIGANHRLVISVAKKYYRGRGVEFMDLIQEGQIGLMRAIKKFEYQRGYKFSTYATWWIRQSVTRALKDQERTIRIPVHAGEIISKLHKTHHILTQKLDRQPTPDEVAEEFERQYGKKMSSKKAQHLLKISQKPLSLEAPLFKNKEFSLEDAIEDEDAPNPKQHTETRNLQEDVRKLVSHLSEREARIISLRYGLIGEKDHTLEEIGEKFGITRERVRQIEAQAFRKLRYHARSNNLVDYFR